MAKLVKINNIEIEIGDISINLSVEQAKELKTILNELFEGNRKTTYIPYPVERERNWQPNDVWYCTASDNGIYTLKTK